MAAVNSYMGVYAYIHVEVASRRASLCHIQQNKFGEKGSRASIASTLLGSINCFRGVIDSDRPKSFLQCSIELERRRGMSGHDDSSSRSLVLMVDAVPKSSNTASSEAARLERFEMDIALTPDMTAKALLSDVYAMLQAMEMQCCVGRDAAVLGIGLPLPPLPELQAAMAESSAMQEEGMASDLVAAYESAMQHLCRYISKTTASSQCHLASPFGTTTDTISSLSIEVFSAEQSIWTAAAEDRSAMQHLIVLPEIAAAELRAAEKKYCISSSTFSSLLLQRRPCTWAGSDTSFASATAAMKDHPSCGADAAPLLRLQEMKAAIESTVLLLQSHDVLVSRRRRRERRQLQQHWLQAVKTEAAVYRAVAQDLRRVVERATQWRSMLKLQLRKETAALVDEKNRRSTACMEQAVLQSRVEELQRRLATAKEEERSLLLRRRHELRVPTQGDPRAMRTSVPSLEASTAVAVGSRKSDMDSDASAGASSAKGRAVQQPTCSLQQFLSTSDHAAAEDGARGGEKDRRDVPALHGAAVVSSLPLHSLSPSGSRLTLDRSLLSPSMREEIREMLSPPATGRAGDHPNRAVRGGAAVGRVPLTPPPPVTSHDLNQWNCGGSTGAVGLLRRESHGGAVEQLRQITTALRHHLHSSPEASGHREALLQQLRRLQQEVETED